MNQKPNTTEPIKKPRGHWFQFRLRTLLIGTMLLAIPCGYVAHEASIVMERRAILKLIVDRGGEVFEGPEDPPILRHLLGDVRGCSILYPRTMSSAEKARISELFPGDWIAPDLKHE